MVEHVEYWRCEWCGQQFNSEREAIDCELEHEGILRCISCGEADETVQYDENGDARCFECMSLFME